MRVVLGAVIGAIAGIALVPLLSLYALLVVVPGAGLGGGPRH